MAKIIRVFLIIFFFASTLFAQVNEYYLVPADLKIGCGDSIVQVNININTIDTVQAFIVGFYTEGTSNPVLDTVLTGGLADTNPPAFIPPSLVSGFTLKIVNPYGPPVDPLLFVSISFDTPLPPSSGLWCRMFYKVTGSGSLDFVIKYNSIPEPICQMTGAGGEWLPINWPAQGVVGSFEVIEIQRGDVTGDGEITVADVIYLIHYMFYNGPPPNPFLAADANCDGFVTISDVVYLINNLFKGGPAPEC
ncbi:MAG: dockerin type I repeat-containing protein [candidate division Zixibacteria bacterium]|nr:dockerin type I repeat-containing protein [candidate division Zixibacteria bacterium]